MVAFTKLRPHKQQSAAYYTKARFVNLACGRGSGKTELARRRVVRFLARRKPWPDPLYFYALPTYNQARRVAWRPIVQLIPKHWIHKINETNMEIETIFGSRLIVCGTDKPQRLEGSQYDGGVVDEGCDQKPGIFDRSILPALSHRNGWCWRIGVPKRYGIGAAEFKAVWERGFTKEGKKRKIESYSWPSSDIISKEEIENAKELLDEKDYLEQYEASWQTAGGLIFYAFDEDKNVFWEQRYDPSLPLIVGSDFNVNPMAWIIAQKREDELHVIDELFIRDTNTQDTLNRLHARYPEHTSGWWFFGDATGRSRKTSAADSDYSIIRQDTRFLGKKVRYPKKNPGIANRFAACNALLKNAAGRHRCFVYYKCNHLINDLKARAYEEGSREPDDYGDVGHSTDALGYVIHLIWPVRIEISGKTEVAAVSYA